jgi:hypothetical protein
MSKLAYAVQNKLPAALLKNASGKFFAPLIDAMTGGSRFGFGQTLTTCESQ